MEYLAVGCTAGIIFLLGYWTAHQAMLRPSAPRRQTCGETIATGADDVGDFHRATCIRHKWHYGEHATTLAALKLIGYTQPPF